MPPLICALLLLRWTLRIRKASGESTSTPGKALEPIRAKFSGNLRLDGMGQTRSGSQDKAIDEI
jgi:hypothetical protein